MSRVEIVRELLAGRYEVQRRLERGFEGEALLALDRETGGLVELRTTSAAALGEPGRLRLEQTARVLCELESPWIAPVLDFGVDGETFIVVIPYVAGVTLRRRLAAGPLEVREAIAVGSCLVGALAAARDAGILHCDVNPANVLVAEHGPIMSATLVDFGLAGARPAPLPHHAELAATVRYMAPERAGLLERQVDQRADLYAVGIVLFECLAGSPPFVADDTGDLLRQHLTAPVPSLRSVGARVPQALEEIVRRLLRKDPDDRYQSAHGALADLEAVAAALAGGIPEPAVVIGSHDRRDSLTEPVLAGRGEELASLEGRFGNVRDGVGGLVLLEAESGGGKTRLLDEFAGRIRGDEAWLLRGQAVIQAAPRPLQLLRGIVAAIVAEAAAEPDTAHRLRTRLAEHHVTALCVMLPELSPIFSRGPGAEPGPEIFAEERSVHALVALLAALGTADRPALVLLDDCQWADDLSVRLLEAWAVRVADVDRGPCHTLLIASFRTEEVTAAHPLRAMSGPRLHLAPLTDEQVGDLAESMAGDLPEAAIDLVQRVARGNPFMASAALRGLVESGALVPGATGWTFDETSGAPQWSHQGATFLARRLDLISPPTQELLSVGAVLGKEFSFELAITLAGLDANDAAEAIREGHDRRLMWTSPDGKVGTFAHDRLREAFLERITPERRAAMHLEAAQWMQAHAPGHVFELAYHFDAAGHSAQALPFAIEAARTARARHLLEIAEVNYRIAERGVGGHTRLRQQIAAEFGQILMLRGQYDESAERLQFAASLARDSFAQAAIQGQLGDLAFKAGDVKEAARRLEDGLRVLGERLPRFRFGFVLRLVWEILVQVAHGTFGCRRRTRQPERAALTAHLYGRLTYAWWFGRRNVPSLWVLVRQLNAAERLPDTPELGHACAIHAVALCAMFPMFWRRGLEFTGRARAIAEKHGDLWGGGQAKSFEAVVLHGAARYAAAMTAADEAVALLDRAGDPWERNTALWHKGLSAYRLGRAAEAIDIAQELYEAGQRLGDTQSHAIGLEIWAEASNGRIPAQPIESALEGARGDGQTMSALLRADGVRLLAAGNTEEAIERFETAVELSIGAGTANVYVVSSLTWLATACRQAAESSCPLSPAERRRRIRRARRATRRAVRYSRLWPNERPQARREAGLVAALAGQPRRARRFLDRGLEVAEAQAAQREYAETLAARGRVGRVAGWQGAAGDLIAAEERRQALDPESHSAGESQRAFDVADRYRTLLDAGRRVTAAASLDELVTTVSDTAAMLLRAEHCALVRVTHDGALVDLSRRDQLVGSRTGTMVERALTANRPVVLTEALADDDPSGDGVLTGARSALCAPIPIHGRPDACLVATHRQVTGLFGDDEVRLAEFIAQLAGAAMEREHLQQEMRGRIMAAQEEERARIARDLHDEIGQALTSVLVGLRRIETSLDEGSPGNPRAMERTHEVQHIASEALGQVQQLAFELRPSVLDDVGLLAAIRRLAGDIACRHGLMIDVEAADFEVEGRIDPGIAMTAYRVVQEAITNVLRHAEARSCSIVLARHDGRLRVVVEDDGVGFDPADVRADAFGLRGMAERAGLAGGNLEIGSVPGQGTTVAMDVPL